MSGTKTFWTKYRDQFESILSEFSEITERDHLANFEWESHGSLKGGRAIHYRGVSILEFGDDQKVKGFKTYFDSAHLVNAVASPH